MSSVEDVKELMRQAEELAQLKESILEDIRHLPENEQEEELVKGLPILEGIDKRYRIIRSEYDILFFTYEYFSEEGNPDNEDNLIPAGVTIEDAPAFHVELCHKLEEQSLYNPTKKIGWAAPRGTAKTTYNTGVYPLHELVYRKRKFIIVLSETADLSKTLIKYISEQLKYNQKLRDDFGELLNPSKMLNAVDNLEAFVTTSGAMVKSGSIGKALRGTRHGSERPDLIICDDLESADNTNTPELREKNLHWYNSVVVPLGTPEKTGIIYMGTLVHGSGLLPNILKRADYDSKIYSSVLQEPENVEMWHKYEEMLLDLEDEDRVEHADSFYYSNQTDMDEGVKVLWESRFPYRDLIKKKVEIGSRAFASEYLNIASDPDSQIFSEDIIHYFSPRELVDDFGRPLPLEYYCFWDIAIGRTKRSDYNAIITLGKDRRTGCLYVVDAWAAKIPMHKAMEMAIQKIAEYRPRIFGVETVQAQYEMFRQLQQECVKQGLYGTRIKPVNPHGKKEERIELLEPLFENGFLKIKKEQRLLREQLEQFPSGDHDDLPDALAGAVNIAGTAVRRTLYRKPEGL